MHHWWTYECEHEDAECGYSIFLTFILWVIFISLALTFPVKDWWEGRPNRLLSVVLVLTVVLIPLYIFLFAVQNPFIDRDGRPMPCITLLVAIFFWPAIFILNVMSPERFEDKGAAVPTTNPA